MFRIRTSLASLAVLIGVGFAGHAQGQGVVMGGFGVSGFQGGFGGFQPGFGGFPQGFMGQQFGVGVGPYQNSSFLYAGNGYGYGVPNYYPPYRYYAPVPQTYNAMGSLINSIESSTSRRGGWRGRP